MTGGAPLAFVPPPMMDRSRGLRRWFNVQKRIFLRRAGHVRRAPRRVAGAVSAGAREMALARLRFLAARSPLAAERLLALAQRLAGARPFLSQAMALARARRAGWTAAGDAIERAFAQPPAPAAFDALPPARLVEAPLSLIAPVSARPPAVPADRAARIVVYTARFGADAPPEPVFGFSDRVRFLCFSDVPRAAPGWRMAPAEAGPGALAALKTRPHVALAAAAPGAEWSLWIDPDRVVVGNLDTLVARWLDGSDFALWRHADGGDWATIAERALARRDAPPAAIVAQAKACEAAGAPRDAAAFDTGVIWRRHGAPSVIAAMDAWWAAESTAPGADALSLVRALAGAPEGAARPDALPAALGGPDDNIFFARRARPRKTPPAGAPAIRPSRTPVTFLYSPLLPNSTTTLLRGKQLSEMVRERCGDRLDVVYTAEIDAVRGRLVVVTKEALWHSPPETLAELRRRNRALIGCWEDMRVAPEKAAHLDAHMTVSIRQMLDLSRLWPGIPAFHVTHHVNRTVKPVVPPDDRLRTAYFGEIANTSLPGSLAGVVDVVGTDTIGLGARAIAQDWMSALADCNCHWIVRRFQWFDGWKPFLKGFVAARCGSPVIVTRDDQNAAHYLGDDYPFYAETLAPADLETAWLRTRAAFGGPEWRLAREIMRQVADRSSEAQVCAEFLAMIDELDR